ncbi:hypothetical protein EDD69_10190 [Thermolongibacillus altinsuensis]|uniref:Calcineurin-like phosphoesterase domain-containing protein n=2 Tax=Thermolongibacillus altinsuensis TaxID=575256 RepID=A0A4R1QLL6_9BACL|nr:hypothetical protein EDD69_10190 [Thermolongibacillus altinsuensis]
MMVIIFFIIVIVAFILLFYKTYKNTHKLILNKVHLSLDTSGDPSPNTFTVLQISDMHLEKISISPKQLYHRLKDEKIDLIALTGDYLDKKQSIPKLIPYLKVFNQLDAKYGIYAVFGNHDYKLKQADFDQLKKTLKKYGCKTLQNENETIVIEGRPVNIIGIDDFYTNRSDLNQAFSGAKRGFHLVLTHDPSIVLQMKKFPFDYLLSGHFHGGQIHWPKPYHLAKMAKKMLKMNMIKGLHFYNGKPFYISEGLGQTLINIRVGSRPEITLHHIPLTNIKEKTLTAVSC